MIDAYILSLINKTPDSLMSGIAQRVKQRRLEKGWTQNMLATKAGVFLASYRRFEEMTDEFENLFSRRKFRSVR